MKGVSHSSVIYGTSIDVTVITHRPTTTGNTKHLPPAEGRSHISVAYTAEFYYLYYTLTEYKPLR